MRDVEKVKGSIKIEKEEGGGGRGLYQMDSRGEGEVLEELDLGGGGEVKKIERRKDWRDR